MRRSKFAILMLVFAGACNAPSLVEPATVIEGGPAASVSPDSTSAETPAEGGTERGASPITMGSGG
jgi:hypothetical protein